MSKPVPQHLSQVAVNQKFQTLARLSKAHELGMKSGFAGERPTPSGRGMRPSFQVPEGHVITHIGDTSNWHGTYMETFPAENVGAAEKIGMVTRNLHPQQFGGSS